MGPNCVNVCDREGNLLMYSNGCAIADRTHNIMENGDSINYGESWEDFCTDLFSFGYPVSQNSLILPDPGNEEEGRNGYYLFHKRTEYLHNPLRTWCPGLAFSYVDMNANGGKGKVTEKNKLIFGTSDPGLAQGYLTACKHANGRDWWIFQIKQDTNIFFKILLTADTVKVVDSLNMTGKFDHNNNRGQAVFTPDGSKWIAFNSHEKVIIYDFDRESGELSNLIRINPQDSGKFVGVAVSPNSRFAYLSAKYDLYQIDLWADDIQSSLVHIDHIDYFQATPGFVSDFSLAQLGPDCKIYIVPGGTNSDLHVINKPNEKGKACDFKQHSFHLPNLNFNGSLPNFPHFRIDESEVCDSTLTSIFGEYVWYRRDMTVWPNPSSGIFNIELPDVGAGKVVVYDMKGQVVYDIEVSDFDDRFQRINISYLSSGRYNVEFYPDRNTRSKSGNIDHRVFYGTQVVKGK
ncbi:MAG: T9SS type A sorting domain-containing protein [Saprospiraceae bacterium]